MSRTIALATTSAAALAVSLSTAAVAQTTAPASQKGPQAGDVSEVVVTAQRRTERLNDVPIAITVQSGAQLERAGVTDMRDLTSVTPGLHVSGSGANLAPAIRGIHSEQTDPGNDPNVALYMDGVYMANQLANNMDLPDVSQIEVLKGPQGTLFGRNATGGAIRITTQAPSFTPRGTIDASYGNLNERSVKAFVTGPLVGDKLAGSLSGFYEARDGYTKDVVLGKTVGGLDSDSIRGKLLFRPTSDVDITLTGFTAWHRDNDALLYEPLNGNTAASQVPGAVIPNKPREVSENPGANPSLKANTNGGSLVANWRTDYGTLTSTSAYINYRTFYDTDGDGSNVNLIDYPIWMSQRDISQEVVFSSKKFGIAQVVAGAFYYNSDGRYDPLVLSGAFFSPTLYGFLRQKTEAYAGFSEVTITPIESLNIIAGARYSEETRDASGSYFISPAAPATLPELGNAKFSSFTPRVSIRYTFPTNDNVYFTWSRGFKSGGFNLSGLATSPFKPEKVDAYEIGLKTDPTRMIYANISAFWYKYSDQQVLVVNSQGLNNTTNAASSDIKGVDAEISTRSYEGLSFNMGLSYLDAHFSSFPGASFNNPWNTTTNVRPIAQGGPCNFCGNSTDSGNASGDPEPYSPKFTISFSGLYHKTFDAGSMDLSATVYHSDKFSFDVQDRVAQAPYTTVAARASFKPQGTNVTLYAYGRNLTDQLFISHTFIGSLGDGVVYAPPRTYGVGLKYQF